MTVDFPGRDPADEMLAAAEVRLRRMLEREEVLQAALESGVALRGVVELDGESLASVWLNRRARDLIGVPGPSALAPEPRSIWLAACRRAAEEARGVSFDVAMPAGDEVRTFAVEVAPAVQGCTGRPRLAWSAVDVTGERLAEEQRHQARKLEAVARLAAGLGQELHDISDLVIGWTEVLGAAFVEGDPRSEQTRQIRRAAERGTRLARQLSAFSRRQPTMPRVVDLGAVVAESARMVRRVIAAADIDLRLRGLPTPLRVHVDPGQIDQVVLNLAINAREAMPRGGVLTIETSRAGAAETGTLVTGPGPWAILSVTDTGIGMSPEVREHLFEPFYTTKPAGRGSGLGLATVWGVARQSGGVVRVETASGEGTAVRVFLPLLDSAAPAPAPVAASELPRGDETILVALEDEGVRQLVRELASEQGYTLLCASGAAAAVEVAAWHPSPIHLVVTELSTAAASGRELVGRLRATRPGMRALLVGELAEAPFADGEGIGYLARPIRRAALARRLRRALDGA